MSLIGRAWQERGPDSGALRLSAAEAFAAILVAAIAAGGEFSAGNRRG